MLSTVQRGIPDFKQGAVLGLNCAAEPPLNIHVLPLVHAPIKGIFADFAYAKQLVAPGLRSSRDRRSD